jgi:hypothetical protein
MALVLTEDPSPPVMEPGQGYRWKRTTVLGIHCQHW